MRKYCGSNIRSCFSNVSLFARTACKHLLQKHFCVRATKKVSELLKKHFLAANKCFLQMSPLANRFPLLRAFTPEAYDESANRRFNAINPRSIPVVAN